MNSALIKNLKYLNGKIDMSFDSDLAHVYLKEYRKNKDEKILAYINRISQLDQNNNYLKYPFLVGYDTIINNMHNYHLLVPEVLSLEISTLEDLFMFHEILTFMNTMMYDEYDQIRKKYQNALDKYSKENQNPLLDLLIKMSVSMKFVNVSLLGNLSKTKSEDNLITNLNNSFDEVLNKKGMYDIYML